MACSMKWSALRWAASILDRRAAVWGERRWEEAVRERARAADLVEEEEEQGRAGPLVRETMGVAPTVALQQSVGFWLTQVVSQLG